MTEIIVRWDNQNETWWNETCALVLEHFGLPGHRFVYTPYQDYMTFKFVNEHDGLMARILLSDRL